MPNSSEQKVTPVLPRNFLRSCILLLLRESPAHGYDLLQRLLPLGFARDDPGRVYRALHDLEKDGLVGSAWERSEVGPDRRIYELTRKGQEELHAHVRTLDRARDVLEGFLGRYEEVAGAPAESGDGRRPAEAELTRDKG
jgi:poly-beta-hydroxybutyrate-responsive repressor